MTSGPVNVRFEHHPTGFGIGTATPRISWELPGDAGVFKQTAYEVELSGPRGIELAVVGAQDQVLVPWPFAPLGSRQRGTVRVRVAAEGAWTRWSEAAALEVALLGPDDWTATFVTPRVVGALGGAAPVLRREFDLSGPVASARLYTTALGVYEAWLNGRRVGDEILAPGWTSFKNRLCYQSFDVTALLVAGPNSLEAMLGNGWYRGQLTWLKRRDLYGDRLAYLAQLEVTYADGGVERLVTDDSWLAAESGVLEDDLYDGQTTDLRTATK
jgi:alpha-L-rhamnosidase